MWQILYKKNPLLLVESFLEANFDAIQLILAGNGAIEEKILLPLRLSNNNSQTQKDFISNWDNTKKAKKMIKGFSKTVVR